MPKWHTCLQPSVNYLLCYNKRPNCFAIWSMDNIIAESSDVMVNSLNFGLPKVTSRRLVNYFPSGSNVYAPNAGNKQIRFLISGDDKQFLDLSSIRVFATLQNTDGDRKKYDHLLDYTHLCQYTVVL